MTIGRTLDAWTHRINAGGSTRPLRIVFAEGDDPRVRQAANRLTGYGLTPVLLCASRRTRDLSAAVETRTLADYAAGSAGARIARIAAERGWTTPVSGARRNHPVYLAAATVAVGVADACVAGSMHATGEVIRAGLHVLGLAPGYRTLSSSFIMHPPDRPAVAFADCAVVPEPDEHQLADIAVSTAKTFESLTGRSPSIAMLSFSTKGSADHAAAQRVRAATNLVRERAPELSVDGELQFDAAFVDAVGRSKAAGSPVAGQANVFVFPNLAAGNIGYKIAERLGGAQAFGPILQGLRAPMNDLSRGCSESDIVTVGVISALQARSAASSSAANTPHYLPRAMRPTISRNTSLPMPRERSSACDRL
ncbi:MAG: phosphotransacetylase, partial [Haloechinothrix sp.]